MMSMHVTARLQCKEGALPDQGSTVAVFVDLAYAKGRNGKGKFRTYCLLPDRHV